MCLKCGKTGHWAAECKEVDPFPYNCHTCGHRGHKAIDCPRRHDYVGKGKGKGKSVNAVEDEHEAKQEVGGISAEEENDWKEHDEDNMELNLFHVSNQSDDEFEGQRAKKVSNGRWNGMKWKRADDGIELANKFAILTESMQDEEEIEGEVMAIQVSEGTIENGKQGNTTWSKITITADSGASISVIPEETGTMFPIEPSTASKNGISFRAANGGCIESLGQRKVKGVNDNGDQCCGKFEVCNVTKPLGAVSTMIDQGNRVVFDADGSYIENKATKKRTTLRRRGGTYEFDIWFKLGSNEYDVDFNRQRVR